MLAVSELSPETRRTGSAPRPDPVEGLRAWALPPLTCTGKHAAGEGGWRPGLETTLALGFSIF